MTNEEIKMCLAQMAERKTSDVMNFDYAGTLAYIQKLESENAEIRARLDKAVEFPVKPDGLCFSPSIKVVSRVDKEGFVVQPVLYLSFKCDNQKQVDEIMDILEGKK